MQIRIFCLCAVIFRIPGVLKDNYFKERAGIIVLVMYLLYDLFCRTQHDFIWKILNSMTWKACLMSTSASNFFPTTCFHSPNNHNYKDTWLYVQYINSLMSSPIHCQWFGSPYQTMCTTPKDTTSLIFKGKHVLNCITALGVKSSQWLQCSSVQRPPRMY